VRSARSRARLRTLPAAAAFADAHLTILNEGPGGRVTTGETVTYRVSVWNSGPDAAHDVSVDTVVDLLADADGVPRGSSATSTQGSCKVTLLTVACSLGSLEAGRVETITIRSVGLSTGPVDSVAKVESEQCPADPCDVDAVPLVIRERKLEVTNALSRPVVTAGGTTRYTVRVRNPSPAVVRHLTVCDVVAPAFVIVDATPNGELVYGEHCWSVRRLAAGAARRFGVTVRPPPDKTGRAPMRGIVTSLDAKDADAKQTAQVIPSG
jgi:uncharacterized repeat protein (TIGR01451 family)